MKCLILSLCLLLCGCASTIEVSRPVMVMPPDRFFQAPQSLQPLPTNPDGSVNAKQALSIIASNNEKANENAKELSALQQWLKDTQEALDKVYKK